MRYIKERIAVERGLDTDTGGKAGKRRYEGV